jgi:hypothetical protein
MDMDIHSSPCPCPYVHSYYPKKRRRFCTSLPVYSISKTYILWYTISHLLLRNPRGWPFKIKKGRRRRMSRAP